MKEQIYTIPVMDAFKEESECPMCILEKNLEDHYIDYVLGPSLMEPDCRIETNEKGFCRRHFELLYNKQENRLGLGLIIDTHLCEQNKKLKKKHSKKPASIKRDGGTFMVKSIFGRFGSRKTPTEAFVDELIEELAVLENKCMICDKMDYTMERYLDVIMYLWGKEEEFRKLFNNNKGFCLKHFRQLLEGTKKYLDPRQTPTFIENLLKLQLENLERVQKEVNWFTEKFDYRNADAPWGNSKDAVQRSIQKLVGYCNLK
ncbi:MAG: ABC transporter substrate-binding protein [Firmicutes bacterium]|nr:ABC transporter substrate-binding protein [Bacillota bacterium]